MKPEKNIIFPLGDKLPKDHFNGGAWLKMLVPDDKTYNCPIGNVTFAPGARNSWHRHSGGQILLVSAGTGYYQEKNRDYDLGYFDFEGKRFEPIGNPFGLKVLPGIRYNILPMCPAWTL